MKSKSVSSHAVPKSHWSLPPTPFVYSLTDTTFSIWLPRFQINVNGLPVKEVTYRNADIHLSRENAFFTIIKGFGFHVEFNHDSLLYVTLQPVAAGKVRGLCGTFNWQPDDDFFTSSENVEKNVLDFTRSYLSFKDACPGETEIEQGSFCARNSAMRTAGHEVCKFISKPKGPFAACHNVISADEIDAFYRDCLESTCEANDLHEACIFLQVPQPDSQTPPDQR